MRAHETDATGAAWSVQAHAICANTTTAVSAATYVGATTSTAFNSTADTALDTKTATATCPAGQSVVGGGVDALTITSQGRLPPPADVVLTVSRPAGDGPTSNAWTASGVEVDPTAGPWRLRVLAFCATTNGAPGP